MWHSTRKAFNISLISCAFRLQRANSRTNTHMFEVSKVAAVTLRYTNQSVHWLAIDRSLVWRTLRPYLLLCQRKANELDDSATTEDPNETTFVAASCCIQRLPSHSSVAASVAIAAAVPTAAAAAAAAAAGAAACEEELNFPACHENRCQRGDVMLYY